MDRGFYNGSGYPDRTAHEAISHVLREEKKKPVTVQSRDAVAEALIKTLKHVIWLSGFRLVERIKIEDPVSGKKYL